MRPFQQWFPLILMWVSATVSAAETGCESGRQFTFAWQLQKDCQLPRGGSSHGAALILDDAPHPGWLSIQEENISTFERDRRAILAMAGGYRTTFDFLEITGYTQDFTRDPPYQSWGTEYIYIVEDKGNFISLQHIMVMQYVDKAGNVSEPVVQKHWRQDWQYEDRELLVYAGNDVRQKKKLSKREVKGTWSQSVFQVDDSPRYESYGKWQHHKNFSTWKSAETWRPVPRRESSFRKDYQVLIGFNRHTITPTGWIQEEENLKTVLDDAGNLRGDFPYLSKELGVARYEKLKDFDFSAGDAYWAATESFWRDVRTVWQTVIEKNTQFKIEKVADATPMFMALFTAAEEAAMDTDYDSAAGRQKIERILQRYVRVPK